MGFTKLWNGLFQKSPYLPVEDNIIPGGFEFWKSGEFQGVRFEDNGIPGGFEFKILKKKKADFLSTL